jgi:hypothetical protein
MERTSIILMRRHEFSVNSVTCDIVERTSVGREAARKKEESALADHESYFCAPLLPNTRIPERPPPKEFLFSVLDFRPQALDLGRESLHAPRR